jgi:ribonuclease D
MFGNTPLIIIEDNAALVAVAERLTGTPVIGVDTEADSFHAFKEKVCLVQLSDLENDYIVDPLKVSDMSPLAPIMADPNTVKVLHGADYDIVSLKRDFGYQFDNVFDTMISAQFLGFDKVGLADLIKRFFGHTIDKKYQRHDWAKRPLFDEHLNYARGDTHWLSAIRELLLIHLQRCGRMAAVEEECAIVQLREWQGRTHTEADFLRVKQSNILDDGQKRVLRAVWEYRNGRAEAANRPAFKLIPDPFLLALATEQPTDIEAISRMARRGSSMVRRHGSALVEAVKLGLEDERVIPVALKPNRARNLRVGPGMDRYLTPLKDWRNAKVKRTGMPPVAVANNTLLKEIARLAPADLAALSEVPGIRRWQLSAHGEEVLSILEGVKGGSGGSEAPPVSDEPKRRRRRRSKKEAE